MKTPNVTVVETTVTDVVKNGWTGHVLGVECETRKEKDYVSCFFVLLGLLWSCRSISFRYYDFCLTPELECQRWVLPTRVVPQPCTAYDSSTTSVGS